MICIVIGISDGPIKVIEKMTYSNDDIINFLKDQSGSREIKPSDDIFHDVGLTVDAFH